MDHDPILLSFISACFQFEIKEVTNSTLSYASAVAVESTYFMRTTNLILPQLIVDAQCDYCVGLCVRNHHVISVV